MKKTAKEISEELKTTSKIVKEKSEEAKKFVQTATKFVKLMDANVEMMEYTAKELDEFYKQHPEALDFPEYRGEQYFNARKVSSLSIPDEMQMSDVSASISGLVNDTTSAVMPLIINYPGYSSKYYQGLPLSYTQLQFTDELLSLLDSLGRHDLAVIWNNAREQLALNTTISLKNSANNARTVVDELSWLPDYKHLEKLKWCELAEGKPIRAVRCAWILYGDDLPDQLNNDSKEEPNYKALNSGYQNFAKYVHLSSFNVSEKFVLESSLNIIEASLINYIKMGRDRLMERIKVKQGK